MDFPERTYHLRVSGRSLCVCHLVHISVLSQFKLLTEEQSSVLGAGDKEKLKYDTLLNGVEENDI